MGDGANPFGSLPSWMGPWPPEEWYADKPPGVAPAPDAQNEQERIAERARMYALLGPQDNVLIDAGVPVGSQPQAVIPAPASPPPQHRAPAGPGLIPVDGPNDINPETGEPVRVGFDPSALQAAPAAPSNDVNPETGDPYKVGFDPSQISIEPTPEEPYAPTVDERAKQMAQLSPVDYARLQATHTRDAQEADIARTAQALHDDDAKARAAYARFQQDKDAVKARLAAIDARAEELANTKVDPDGWRDSRNLFQTIAMYAAGVVGGLVQSRQGGPNQGLAMINAAIEKHIDAQKANLAHRRSMLGMQRESVMDAAKMAESDYMQEEAFRISAWDRTIRELQAMRLSYDPNGTRAIALAQAERDATAALAQHKLALYEKGLDLAKKQTDINVAIANQKEQARHNRISEGNAARAASLAERKFKYDVGQDSFKNSLDIAKAFGPGKADTAQQKLDFDKEKDFAARAVGGANFIGLRGKSGKPIADENGLLLNGDGRPYQAPDGEGTAARNKLTAARNITDVQNEILAIRDRVGGELGLLNSDDHQRLKVLAAWAKGLKKEDTHGMSSDADMELIADMAGVNDATSFRDQTARIEKARDRTVDALNAWYGDHLYTGERIDFGDRWKNRPPPVNESVSALTEKPPLKQVKDVGFFDLPSLQPEALGGLDNSPVIAAAANSLAEQVRAGDATAAQRLAEIAAGAPDPRSRKLAADALLKLKKEGNQTAAQVFAERTGDVLSPLIGGE